MRGIIRRMPFKIHPMSSEVQATPREAADTILRTYESKEGNLAATLKKLDASGKTFNRWLEVIEQKGIPIKARLAKAHKRFHKAGKIRMSGSPPSFCQ